MFIIMMVVAIIIGAGGMYATERFRNKGAEPKKPEVENLPVHPVALEERTVNLADYPNSHYLRTTVVAEVAGEGEMEELMKERMPRFMDRLIDVLSREHYNDLLYPPGKKALKEKLRHAFEEEVADKGLKVKGVLFTEFVME
jgi:flagellar basal body-associated protein FliL